MKAFSFLSVLFLISFSIFGQSKVEIRGTVIDSETKELLPGASVIVENKNAGCVTDFNGAFRLKTDSEFPIRLQVSFISYKKKAIEIKSKAEASKELTVSLIPDNKQLEEVEVKAKAQGQVKAMLEQKEAANIINVISAEQIEKFPDKNAADALSRIPGITVQREMGEGKYVQVRGTPPSLTNFNINGEQIPSPEGGARYVGMDIISADQIDFIEVTKVLTPDMDADGIGGTVNIITKKAEEGEPQINISLAGGYNDLRQSDNYQAQISYGARKNKLGFNMNASYYKNNQGADNIEFDFTRGPFWSNNPLDTSQNYHIQYDEVQLRHYETTRERLGVSATIDYELNENTNFYLRGMFNKYADDELRRRLIYTCEDAITFDTYYYGDVERDIKDRIKEQQVNTINFGGEHKYEFLKLDYEFAYSLASENQPDRLEAEFDSPGHGLNIRFVDVDTEFPKVEFIDSSSYNHAYNFEEYSFDEIVFNESKVIDENYTFKTNLAIPYDLNNSEGFFKFGVKTRRKEKSRDIFVQEYSAYYVNSWTYPDQTAELNYLDIIDDFETTNLLNQGYTIDYMPSADKIRSFYETNQHHFIYNRSETAKKSVMEDYYATEDIFAGYAMFQHDFSKLMILGGLRYSKTIVNYTTNKVYVTENNKYDYHDTISDKREHDFFLPQIQIKYNIRSNTNIRAAITRSYSRPNFDDVIPFQTEDRNSAWYGNADLKYPVSLNFDVLYETYLISGGIISGGLFYKEIEDFIVHYKFKAHGGEDFSDFGLQTFEKPDNGIIAFVKGAEIQYQSKFNFFTGFARDFGIYFNYTFTDSEAYFNKRYESNDFERIFINDVDSLNDLGIIGEREKLTLPGQAKNTLNLAFYYETRKMHFKITANYHDSYLHTLGADAGLDEYYDKAWHWDLNGYYTINDQMKIFFEGKNLTNTPLRYYLGTPDRTQKLEYYSWSARIGIKLFL